MVMDYLIKVFKIYPLNFNQKSNISIHIDDQSDNIDNLNETMYYISNNYKKFYLQSYSFRGER